MGLSHKAEHILVWCFPSVERRSALLTQLHIICMESKPTSPRRVRGPGEALKGIVEENGNDECSLKYAGSSRSTFFSFFRRQPSKQPSRPLSRPKTNTPSLRGVQSLRSQGKESFSAAFDNLSFNTSSSGLQSPQQAQDTAGRLEFMLKAAKKYRQAAEAMALAAGDFGTALASCAETKGAAEGRTPLPDHAVDLDLHAAGGLHLVISSHIDLLASSLKHKVEEPMENTQAQFVRRLAEREESFKASLRTQMQALRVAQTETQRRDSRKRGMNLSAYRNTLLDLTSQIDDINRLKFEFLSDVHALTIELAESLHSSIASAVTAEIEVFENIARKGWSGGGLDGLLTGCPDPFDLKHKQPSSHASQNSLHSEQEADSNLFSIIPPQPILPGDSDSDAADLTLTPQNTHRSRKSTSDLVVDTNKEIKPKTEKGIDETNDVEPIHKFDNKSSEN